MTTAYRSDLLSTVFKSKLANLLVNQSLQIEPSSVPCPGQNCGVQYSLLGPKDAPEKDVLKQRAAVVKALKQQFCPHHPPEIEVD
jgi:hypothetical protein